jgi:predicted MFS family arabinose efflux permease
VAWVLACIITAAVVARVVPADQPGVRHTAHAEEHKLPASAWRIIFGSAATAGAGLTVLVVSGVWLEDRFGLSARSVAAVAIAFGLVELAASLSTVRLTDRLGKPRAVAIGLTLVAAGLGLLLAAGDGAWLGVTALTVFLGGFEFAFVSSLALVSEAAPAARGRAVGTGNAVATLARAGAAGAAGVLYEAAGIGGPVALAGACGLVAFVLLAR